MTPQTIRQHVQRPGFWQDIQVFDALPSSIDALKAQADDGAAQGTAVVALAQTAGRGRLGNAWSSPCGGVWLSALLRPALGPQRAGCMSVAAGVAIAQALSKAFEIPVQVKWPNDLWVRGKKLGGVLVELSTRAQHIEWMIVSVGINVNNPLPAGVRIPPTSLGRELARRVPLEVVAAAALDGIASGFCKLEQEGFDPFIDAWERLSALGDTIEFERGGRRTTASVVGLSDDGKLVVNTPAGSEYLAAEDIHLQPLQGSQQ